MIEIWINNISQELRYPNFDHMYIYFFVLYPARGITMCCIIYMTVMLAFQRYNAIAKPLCNHITNPPFNNTSWLRVFKFVGPVILFSIIFKLPEFFEVTTETIPFHDISNNTNLSSPVLSDEKIDEKYNTSTSLVVSNMRANHWYVLVYMNISNLIVTGLIPLFMLAYFNLYIYQGMQIFIQRRVARRGIQAIDTRPDSEVINQRNQTIILFAIVILFVVCHISSIFNIILDI